MEKENSKLVNNLHLILPHSTSHSKKIAIADTGAPGSYLEAYAPQKISLRQTSPIRAKQSNGQMLKSTKGCTLAL